MHFPARWSAAVAVLLALTACAESIAPDRTPAHVTIVTTETTLTIGETTQLTATVVNRSHEPIGGKAVAWSSSAPSVAVVGPTGVVTALSPGTAVIRATHEEIFGVVQFTVEEFVCSAAASTPMLALGAAVTGSISSADCLMQEFWRAEAHTMTFAATDTVLLRLVNPGNFAQLMVSTSTSELGFAFAASDEPGDTARLAFVAPPGTYRVWSMLAPGVSGNYTLTAAPASLCSAESALAGIAVGQTIAGSVTSASCLLPHSIEGVGYSFSLDTATGVAFDVQGTAFSPAVVITDHLLNAVAVGMPTPSDSTTAHALLPAGNYLAWVTTVSGGLGTFDLTRRDAPVVVCTVATDTITIGAIKNGIIGESDCALPDNRKADLIHLNVPGTTNVQMDLVSNDFDAFLIVRNADGDIVAADDDGGDGFNSRIITALPAGQYTIVATTYAVGMTGSYSLSVQPSTGVQAAPLVTESQARDKTAPPNSPSSVTASPSRANRSSWLRPLR